MDNLVIKLIDSIKIPGIIITVIYFVYQLKFFSIIKSSSIERLFFTHEKNMVYRAFNWVMLFLTLLILLEVISFAIWFLIPKNKFILLPCTKIIFDILFILIFIIPLVFCLIRKHKKVSTYLEGSNINNKLSIAFTTYFTVAIFTLPYTVTTAVYGLGSMNKIEKEISIALSVVVISLFLPAFLKMAIFPWIYKEKIVFSFNDNGDLWYIIKPLKENDFLVGDNYKEEECQKIRFISYDDIKKQEISIRKYK